jgi:glycosyltransferase involved in cell wall biosynthesis
MKEIEIILVDNCSTDNSLDIIKNYMKNDKRIRLIKIRKIGKYYIQNQLQR